MQAMVGESELQGSYSPGVHDLLIDLWHAIFLKYYLVA